MLLEEEITQQIIGAAIEMHRTLGPGLLESAYEECLGLVTAIEANALQASGRYPRYL